MRLILHGGSGMEFIIETPLSPHMAGPSTGLIARDSLLPYMASRASRCKSEATKSKSCSLEQTRSNLCYVGSVCSSHLVCATHLVDKRGALEQARITLCPVGSVKVFCVFLLTLEQTQPTLLPAGLVKTRHFEQAPSDLRPASSVKVDTV